jgi:hypothetical protein
MKYLKHMFETLGKTREKTLKNHYKQMQYPDKTLATYVWGITPDTHRAVHGPSRQGGPTHKNQAALGMAQVDLRRKTA